ncbi:MAG: metallophosphoesterase [Euryarchaeota archaeon]|nr:metallophosphoesterase [Euryarchaeota archaeon]
MIMGFGFKYKDYAIFADTHFGIEYVLASQGLQIPPIQFEEVLKRIKTINAQKLIIAGDLKHEFSRENPLEKKHVSMFIENMTSMFDDLIVVRGNHDNFVYYTLKSWGIDLIEYLEIGDIIVIHGHKVPNDIDLRDYELVVMGHEHPSISIRDSLGLSHKIPVHLEILHPEGFLIHVLPAVSPLALGTPVNALLSPEDFLSPILRSIRDLGGLRIYAVLKDKVEFLGTLSRLESQGGSLL